MNLQCILITQEDTDLNYLPACFIDEEEIEIWLGRKPIGWSNFFENNRICNEEQIKELRKISTFKIIDDQNEVVAFVRYHAKNKQNYIQVLTTDMEGGNDEKLKKFNKIYSTVKKHAGNLRLTALARDLEYFNPRNTLTMLGINYISYTKFKETEVIS